MSHQRRKQVDEGSQIRQSYLNQRFSGSYSGLSGFLRNRRKWRDKKIVDRELKKLNSYALHKPARKNFKRRRIMVHFINEIWAIDLKDISTISKDNRGMNFVMVVVDGLSKKAWTRPLKDKSADTIIRALKSIIREAKATPHYLFSDYGTEFVNTKVKAFLKEHNIIPYQIHSHIKSSWAERFIRSLFTKLERYKTERKTNKIVDVLQDFTHNYNATFHRSINMAPNQVNKNNEMDVWAYLFRDLDKQAPGVSKKPVPKFAVGDRVRISRYKLQFEKGKCTVFKYINRIFECINSFMYNKYFTISQYIKPNSVC